MNKTKGAKVVKSYTITTVHGWREAINYFDNAIRDITFINKNNQLRGGVFQFA